MKARADAGAADGCNPPRSQWTWVPGNGAPDVQAVGGKASQLAALHTLAATHEAHVPRFVVVRTEAYVECAVRSAALPEAPIATTPLPDALATDVQQALHAAGLQHAMLAVRSSATLEDGASASFAGQFATVLGVRANDRDALHAAIREVWASVAAAHAVAYQQEHDAIGLRMAVVLQELVEPYAAGVAFALDPVSGDTQTAVVSAVYGLGEGLVSGELDADTWHVPADTNATPRYAASVKQHAIRSQPNGGTVRVEVPASMANRAVLSDHEVSRIAFVVRSISESLGTPQDMEWALVGHNDAVPRELVLLQTRPITTANAAQLDPPAADDPRGPGRRVWDNANIVESYSGVTTPLTFTFARSVYEDVYRQFCRLMGVEEPLIASSESAFAHMLGLVRGRVYYSLINWYRLIALLPGFEWNRSFMERMMGVREALEAPPPPPSSGNRLRDLLRLLRMVLRMIRAYGTLTHEVPAFHARVDAALAPLRTIPLDTWEAPRIAALYRKLEQSLLHHWRPPLVNDFFAMIFFGVQGQLITRWLPTAAPTLGNDLLCGEGGIVSTEPARRVMAMAKQVQESEAWRAMFARTPDDTALWHRLATEQDAAPLMSALAAYIDTFGDRCLEELKLETITLREDPAFLVQMVRSYAQQGSMDPDAALAHERRVRRDAEAAVRTSIGGWRAAVFFWVVRQTRARVRDRENLRFERTRVFGIVRRMALGAGAAFVRSGLLRDQRDVFWLTLDEMLALAEDNTAPVDLRTLVTSRRETFGAWQRAPAPPDRFETSGALGDWEGPPDAQIPRAATLRPLEGDLIGTGCCPGVVRAPVRIVRDPREAVALSGCILVAERTDPGWTLLFPAASGLLVQRGSLLSHSAIVAREMALPCVVGIVGLLETLVDGEIVEMDGTTGVVRRHTEESK